MSQAKNDRQRLLNKIQKEIEDLQKEFQELQMLKEAADEIENFRRILLTEARKFD